MRYKVKLFAGVAELIGQHQIEVTEFHPQTVSGLRNHLKELYPNMSFEFDRALFAINQRFAPDHTVLTEGDEIALIPPVGGGSEGSAFTSCMLSADPLSITDAYTALENAHCGGTVLFCGTVREWTNGVQTDYLSYEAYEEMAMTQMKQIEADVQKQWPTVSTLQWHRIGRLQPKEIAVICAAASPHRDIAFDAARTLIERVKKEVPIWKKEVYTDGRHTWQENDSPSL